MNFFINLYLCRKDTVISALQILMGRINLDQLLEKYKFLNWIKKNKRKIYFFIH